MTDSGPLPFGVDDVRRLVDRLATEATQAVAQRPLRVRMRPSLGGMLTGRLDEVEIEMRGVATTGLLVDRVVIRSVNIRTRPGLPPRLQADAVDMTGTVTEEAVNRWLRTDLGPFRVRLRDDGIAVRTGVAGIKVNEVRAELDVEGRWLRLRPTRAEVLGVPTPMTSLFRGYLPMPALPSGAKLGTVTHGHEELSATVELGELDEPIDAGLTQRLIRRVKLAPLSSPED
ncbi:MAG: LmeA family phospholipid-binding protein [Actinomycetota bacterium]